jgi:TonB family protein
MQLSYLRELAHPSRHILRWLLIPVILVFPFRLMSQELISTEFEKGYVKDGVKYSVWDYYNSNKELELKINHTTGKVYFLKGDTSYYVIEKDGEWIEQKLQVHPIPIDGYHNFHLKIKSNIRYPVDARRMGIDGVVVAIFEVDSTGVPGNYRIIRGISASCDKEVLSVLEQTQTRWIPAQINGITYRSRFIVPIIFSLGNNTFELETLILPLLPAFPAKVLLQNSIRSLGIKRESVSLGHPRQFAVRTYRSPRYFSLEEALGAQRKVEYISLVGQNLKEFPVDIAKLDDLIYLDLENNQLTELPGHISALQKLEELYFPFNRLRSLPDEFTSMQKLSTLSLGSNQFSEFPQQLCSCLELEALDLGENDISTIPPCIGALKKLKIIALNSNQIRSLPEEFYNLKRLEAIYLKDNPLDGETVKRIQSNFRKAKIILE